MMQSMKGATSLLGSMNRQMNLPALQRIAMEFEKENDIMDQRQDMMDDAIDDVTGLEDEEEGEEVVNKVLDEIGVDLNQSVGQGWFVKEAENNKLTVRSSARLRKACRAIKSRKARSRKRLEVAVILATTICKHDLTAYEDNDDTCAYANDLSMPSACASLQCLGGNSRGLLSSQRTNVARPHFATSLGLTPALSVHSYHPLELGCNASYQKFSACAESSLT